MLGTKRVRSRVPHRHNEALLCSDPRDRIYALSSLLPDDRTVEVEPDCTKSVHEVYRDVALSFIRTSRRHNLHILTLLRTEKETKESHPGYLT